MKKSSSVSSCYESDNGYRKKIRDHIKNPKLQTPCDYEKVSSTSSSSNDSENGHEDRVQKKKKRNKKQYLNRLTRKSSVKQDLGPLVKPIPVKILSLFF